MTIYSFDIKYNNNGFWLKTVEKNGIQYIGSLDATLDILSITKTTEWDTHGMGTARPRTGLNKTQEFKEKPLVSKFFNAWLSEHSARIEKCLAIIKAEGFKKPEGFENGIYLAKDPSRFLYDERFQDIFHPTN